MIDTGRQHVSSAQEVLAGLVERVTYHNQESGFCVLKVKARGHATSRISTSTTVS